MTLRDSLNYAPVELGFGTSGLRGLVVDMTDLECYINSIGFLHFLEEAGQLSPGDTVYVAGDLRSSTPRIILAVARAIEDKGCIVGYGGLVPTPAIAHFALRSKAASIMVTGSHIPADRNGIKFYKVGGEILKGDEQSIKDAVATERARVYATSLADSVFDDSGNLEQKNKELPAVMPEVRSEYLNRYLDIFNNNPLINKNVVVYQHSAVGRDLLVELLSGLGANVTVVGRSDTFVSIDTENVTPSDQAYFRQIAQDNPGCFAIVSTDGDSDRPFVVDENGLFHRGDELGAIVARWLKAAFVAIPISSSDAVDQFLADESIDFVHTRIGSPYVIEAMNAAMTSEKKNIVGWEVNGGFLLGSDVTIMNNILTALPTRDAFFPIIASLIFASDENKSLSNLFKQLPSRYTQAGLVDGFAVETSKKIIEVVSLDNEDNRAMLSRFFLKEDGFDEIAEINVVDGIRVYFKNGDIAHLRPSGNAPQMRMYSVSDTQERADRIVELGIAEKGILANLAEQFKS